MFRPQAAPDSAPFGALEGRVLDGDSGAVVAGAEVTFAVGDTASGVQTNAEGVFRLAPDRGGTHRLVSITAPGYLAYEPEWRESPVELAPRPRWVVRGVTLYLFAAIAYQGRVIDEEDRPVAGAQVRLVGATQAEQRPDGVETEWTSDAQGRFVARAQDDAVFEAAHAGREGEASLDRYRALTQPLTIRIRSRVMRATTPLEGRVRRSTGEPVPGAIVRAQGGLGGRLRTAITDAQGRFKISGVEQFPMFVSTEVEGSPPAEIQVFPGREDAELVIETGAPIRGRVLGEDGIAVPAATILVTMRHELNDQLVVMRSILDPDGTFELRVRPGTYFISASAPARGASDPVAVHVPESGARIDLTVSDGGEIAGLVHSTTGAPIPDALVVPEGPRYGSSVLPTHVRAVTAKDGRFTLTGLTPGRVAITLRAAGYHPKVVGGVIVRAHVTAGPLDVALTPLADGEMPKLELVGIGVSYGTSEHGLRIGVVIPGSGAEAAGLAVGDVIIGIDGSAVETMGRTGATAQMHGAEGTTVLLRVLRDGRETEVVVTRGSIRW